MSSVVNMLSLLILEQKIVVQGVCYFINKIPKLYIKGIKKKMYKILIGYS
jgi:hypothetical protein